MELQLMRIRKEAGFKNRDDFAEAHGFNKYTYRSWESGAAQMSLQQACEICDILGCTLDELAGRNVPGESCSSDEKKLLHDYRSMGESYRQTIRETAGALARDSKSCVMIPFRKETRA